jgi:energy-coupling factor transport system permease protein
MSEEGVLQYKHDRLKMFTAGNALTNRTQAKAGNIRVAMKLLFCLSLSVLAFGNTTTAMLLMLSGVNLLLIVAYPFRLCAVRQGAVFFLSQSIVIVALYLIRFGTVDAVWSGFRISWQLFLAFLPGLIFVETTPQPRIVQALTVIMSHRSAFVMATCLKFLPLLVDEIRAIYEGQVMRGARIQPQDLLKPWNWLDVIHCLVVPAIIQTMKLAGDIALAAKARDFGVNTKRTCWPGE